MRKIVWGSLGGAVAAEWGCRFCSCSREYAAAFLPCHALPRGTACPANRPSVAGGVRFGSCGCATKCGAVSFAARPGRTLGFGNALAERTVCKSEPGRRAARAKFFFWTRAQTASPKKQKQKKHSSPLWFEPFRSPPARERRWRRFRTQQADEKKNVEKEGSLLLAWGTGPWAAAPSAPLGRPILLTLARPAPPSKGKDERPIIS
ncbi:hypothetical protein TraAM80_09679 [Trypanosoma rangeli]|uniref:Uncharacterized protein n=1 Tax=Trypanosoma rangeli TaxID=5698 RepID=A0A3R7M5T3_TRYRA|nr:uncharacterized protein TraAM80_09679 [Trypanosoma rangeli]RNE96689.1 hypothetical protein TraAM80_09679 [Trypanosoma rangeli]|eukprot:RNE96689.1 hypothetical protein TraAM80_09679 [Trypanosoma rangeli]